MSKLKISFLVLVSFLFNSNIQLLGQDLIYSQFNAMPLAVNPAFAGNNACNYRVSAIGRSQWAGVENLKSYNDNQIELLKNENDCILEISAEKLQPKNLFDFF